MKILSALFWYLLGGLTLLPISILIGYFSFLYLFPKINRSARADAEFLQDDSLPLDPQLKAAALDLAVKNDSNHKAHVQHSESLATQPKGSTQVPSSARRLGPPPSDLPPLPHRSGILVVRRQFQDTSVGSAQSGSSLPAGGDQVGSGQGYVKAGDAVNKTSYMSGLYRGLMDYRSSKKAAGNPAISNPANQGLPQQSMANTVASAADSKPTASTLSSSSAANGSSGYSSPNRPLSGTGSITTFHCILKPPILYLYSSSDVSSPLTECHAAIDLRGKRVSLFINGVGDTMGEPGEDAEADDDDDDDQHADHSSRGVESPGKTRTDKFHLNQYDTTSSTNVSDNDMNFSTAQLTSDNRQSKPSKRAQRNWNKARRATIRDGELFQKRNAIRIVAMGVGERVKDRSKKRDRNAGGHRDSYSSPTTNSTTSLGPTNRAQWFIFCKSASHLEDWYHALLHASLMPSSLSASSAASSSASFDAESSPIGSLFNSDHMIQLLASLDSIPDPIPLRWFNAILARLFFSVYKTSALENYITRKIMKKLSRVKTPGFLGDIVVREVDVGERPPMFSRPMLKSATGEGEASMEVSVHYTGSLRITISTTLTISLSSRLGLKPYTVPLVLAVVVRSLNGNLLLHVKPPPSNRLWFGFTKLPEMEIEVQPVVSERKVQWGMVTRLIESRIRELLAESIVLPNMDDVPFFDTRQLAHRGGIWKDARKRAAESTEQDSNAGPSQLVPGVASKSKAKSQGYYSPPATAAGTPEADQLSSSRSSALEVPGPGSSTDGSTRRRKNSNSSRVHLSPSAGARPSTSTSADALAVGSPVALSTGGSALDDARVGESASKLSSSPSSAAAAGLSSLLAKDFAAQSQVEAAGSIADSNKNSSAASLPAQLDGTSIGPASASDRSQIQMPNKRRSWFVGPRFGTTAGSSASSPSSEYGPSSPAINVPASISKKGAPQSSLAWGNASLSLPTGNINGRMQVQRPESSTSTASSTSPSSHAASGNSFEPEVSPDSESNLPDNASDANPQGLNHQRNKESVSSWSTEESEEEKAVLNAGDESGNESIHSADTDSFRAGMERAFELEQDEGRDDEARENVLVQSEIASQAEPPTPRRLVQPDPIVDVREPSRAKALLPAPDEPKLEPPLTPMASLSSRRGSAQSLIPRLKETPPRNQDQEPAMSRDGNEKTFSPLASRRDTASTTQTSDTNTDSTSQSDASSVTTADSVSSLPSAEKVFGASHGFPPPLLRSATLKAQQGASGRPRDSSASNLQSGPSSMSAAQQSRYGLVPDVASPSSPTNPPGSSSTLLLNSWNKAKASMVDRDSRQAAAKEARDALKKGWASWNTKRMGASVSQESDRQTQPSESSSFHGSVNAQKASTTSTNQAYPRSRTSSWLGDAAETSDPASLGLGFDVDRVDSNSHTSSSNDRAAFRDRLKDEESRSSGSERTPYKDYRLQRSNRGSRRSEEVSQNQTLASTAHWTASVPSLSAPAPAARRKDDDAVGLSSEPESSSATSVASRLQSLSHNHASPVLGSLGPQQASTRPSSLESGMNSSYAAPQAPRPIRKASATSLSESTSSPQFSAMSPKSEHAEVRRGSTPTAMSPPSSEIPLTSAVGSASTSKSAGIKTQPGRAAMMQVPGMNSMSRGPQSFSSPDPESTPLPSNQASNQDVQKGLGMSLFREMFNRQQAQEDSESVQEKVGPETANAGSAANSNPSAEESTAQTKAQLPPTQLFPTSEPRQEEESGSLKASPQREPAAFAKEAEPRQISLEPEDSVSEVDAFALEAAGKDQMIETDSSTH